jgi:hypothetical protein
MLVFVKPPSKDAKVIYMFLRTGPKILSLKMMMKILVNKVYYIFYSVKNDHENGLTMRHRDDKVFVEGSRVILTLPNPKVWPVYQWGLKLSFRCIRDAKQLKLLGSLVLNFT